MKARDRDAIVTGRSTGYPVRVIKNKFAKEYVKMESEEVPFEELEKLGAGRLRLAVAEGDIANGSLMAGQISGMIKDIKSCKDIIEDIIKEAEEELNRLYRIKRGE